MSKYSLGQIVSLFLILLCLTSCAKKAEAPPNTASRAVSVSVLKLEPIKFYDSAKYLATLKSRHSVDLSSEVTGKVQNIYVSSGQRVPAGKLLISLRSDEEESSLNAQVALSQIKSEAIQSRKANLTEAKVNLEFAQNQYERYQKLQAQGLITKSQLEDYENRLQRAQSVYNSLKYDVAGAQSDLKQASSQVNEKRARLNKLRITAPFEGNIQDIPIKVGDLVAPQTKLLSISNTDSLELYVNIPANKAASLQKGSIIDLIDEEGNSTASSKVSFIGSTVEPESQTVLVKAVLQNENGLFRDNQQIQCRIKYKEKTGLLVPTTAISRFGAATFVYIIENKDDESQIAKQKSVELGDIQGNSYEVISGLEAGQTIAISGTQQLSDGASVKIAEKQKP